MLVHAGMGLGAISLAAGFMSGSQLLMRAAFFLLGLSFTAFIWMIAKAVTNSSARRDSGIGIGLALISLSITILLGLWLAAGYGWDEIQLARGLTDTHLAWGLLGWVGVLLMTVAYEVVPMFQLTPPYPRWLTPWLAPAHIIALILWSGWIIFPESILTMIGGITLALSLSLFAGVTLWLQHKRKKKQADTVVWFWRYGMISIISAASIWLYAQFSVDIIQQQTYQMLLGTLVILGFAISLINGMLYKIIPFLIWLHLSIKVTELKLSRRLIPNIKKIIPDTQARLQFWFHSVALLLFLTTVFQPYWVLMLAALVFAASNILLLRNIILALKLYSRTETEIVQAGART